MTVFRFFLALVIGTASGLALPQARVTAATHNPMLSGQCCPPPAATPRDSLQASSLQLSSVGVHSQVPACRGVTSAKMPAARFSLYMSETLPEPSEAAQPVAETATPATMPPAAPKQADVWSSMASQATRVGCNTGGVAFCSGWLVWPHAVYESNSLPPQEHGLACVPFFSPCMRVPLTHMRAPVAVAQPTSHSSCSAPCPPSSRFSRAATPSWTCFLHDHIASNAAVLKQTASST